MPENKPIQFRRDAQEQLVNPEDLQAAVALVKPQLRFAISGLAFFLVVVIAWSAWAKVPIKILGSGVITLSGQELSLPIASEYSGQVQTVLISRGQQVREGEAIARLSQPRLEDQLQLARQDLQDKRDRFSQSTEILQTTLRSNNSVRLQQGATLQREIDNLRNRLPFLQQREQELTPMLAQRLVSRDEFNRAQLERQTAEEDLARETASLVKLDADEEEELLSIDRQQLELTQAVTEAESQVQVLVNELDLNSNIFARQSGTIAEINIVTGDYVNVGSRVALIAPESNARSEGQTILSALLYVPLNRGKRIEPGMTALLDVSSILENTFGKVRAEVVSVSDFAISPETLALRLNNEAWSNQIMAAGVPFEVLVNLIPDSTEASGFEWTSSPGPQIQLSSGTFVQGEINQDYTSLLSLVIPAIKGLLQTSGQ